MATVTKEWDVLIDSLGRPDITDEEIVTMFREATADFEEFPGTMAIALENIRKLNPAAASAIEKRQ